MGTTLARLFWMPINLAYRLLLSISIHIYAFRKRRHIAANPPKFGGARPASELGDVVAILADYAGTTQVERLCEAPSGLSFMGLYRLAGDKHTIYLVRNRHGKFQVEGTSMFLVNYCNFLKFMMNNPPPEEVRTKLLPISYPA